MFQLKSMKENKKIDESFDFESYFTHNLKIKYLSQ